MISEAPGVLQLVNAQPHSLGPSSPVSSYTRGSSQLRKEF